MFFVIVKVCYVRWRIPQNEARSRTKTHHDLGARQGRTYISRTVRGAEGHPDLGGLGGRPDLGARKTLSPISQGALEAQRRILLEGYNGILI